MDQRTCCPARVCSQDRMGPTPRPDDRFIVANRRGELAVLVGRQEPGLRALGPSGQTVAVTPGEKTCVSCGRRIEWRAKWERDWDQVRYCSAACRRRGVTAEDRLLEQTVLSLLADRAATATICPSEVARTVGTEESWRSLMEPARRAAPRRTRLTY
jgi:hypothetical protein